MELHLVILDHMCLMFQYHFVCFHLHNHSGENHLTEYQLLPKKLHLNQLSLEDGNFTVDSFLQSSEGLHSIITGTDKRSDGAAAVAGGGGDDVSQAAAAEAPVAMRGILVWRS